MPNDFNTGVEEPLQPAADGAETEVIEDSMPLDTEDDAPDFAEFADFFEKEASEENADSGDKPEKQGLDSPPKTEPTEKTEQKNYDQTVYRTQSEFDKAFAKRLREETGKIRKEYETKYAKTDADIIEGRAHKIIEESPEVSLPLARRIAKQELAAEKPAEPAESDEPIQDVQEKNRQARLDIFKEAWKNEEPLLRQKIGKSAIEFAEENNAFKILLRRGMSPMMAYDAIQELTPLMEKAKTDGQREAVRNIRESNAHATTQSVSAKATGKPQSAVDRINNMSLEDLDKALLEAERRGKKGIYIGED